MRTRYDALDTVGRARRAACCAVRWKCRQRAARAGRTACPLRTGKAGRSRSSSGNGPAGTFRRSGDADFDRAGHQCCACRGSWMSRVISKCMRDRKRATCRLWCVRRMVLAKSRSWAWILVSRRLPIGRGAGHFFRRCCVLTCQPSLPATPRNGLSRAVTTILAERFGSSLGSSFVVGCADWVCGRGGAGDFVHRCFSARLIICSLIGGCASRGWRGLRFR